MRYLTKDDLPKLKLQTKDVEVSQWNCKVRMRVMTGRERATYEEFVTSEPRPPFMAMAEKLLAVVVIDEAGNPLFDEGVIGDMDANVLFDLSQKAIELNKLSPDDLGDLEKNSESGQG